jgi:polar amino acid transport system substrate-binding protein
MKKLTMCIMVVLGMCGITIFVSAGDEIAKITVHYYERPPYLVATPTGPKGLTADPIDFAFKKTGIPFQWEQTPPKRQMELVQNNRGRDCIVNWFKNPEREKFAKYSSPLYQDKPQIALARADNHKIQSEKTVAEVLSDPNLTLLVKDGYSYGGYLDTQIAERKPTVEKTDRESPQMLKMIHAGRADYFFIAPEEAEGLISSAGLPKEDFKFVTFSDMPQGEKRYILCSQQVEDAVIEKLNAAITEYVNAQVKP